MINGNKIKILVIEDDKIDQLAFARFFAENSEEYDSLIAGSLEQAGRIMENNKFDIIVSDYALGDGYSIDNLDFKRDIPIVIITGGGDEEVAIKAMKAGASDYIIKDIERNYLKILPITVDNAIKNKKNERKMKMLSQAMMNIADGVYITDTNEKIVFVNEAFCQTYGYKEEEMIGMTSEIIEKKNGHTNGSASAIINNALDGNFVHVKKDGTVFPANISKSIIYDDNGNKIAIVGITRDMTIQKKTEREKIRQEKLQGVLEMAGAACHELNQPLQAIMGYTDLILMDMEETNPNIGMMQEIKKEVERLGKITRKLNGIARYETMEYLDGSKIIDINKASGKS